jgi:hypothetical protein
MPSRPAANLAVAGRVDCLDGLVEEDLVGATLQVVAVAAPERRPAAPSLPAQAGSTAAGQVDPSHPPPEVAGATIRDTADSALQDHRGGWRPTCNETYRASSTQITMPSVVQGC